MKRFVRKMVKRVFIAGIAMALLCIVAFAIAWHVWPFPVESLDNWPTSAMVTDRNGEPLLEIVGSDDQWRVPVDLGEMSPNLIDATIAIEDERFREHGGVDLIAVGRASLQNIKSGRVISGASTITMQLCRMINDQPRTWRAKVAEAFRAIQLESLRDKDSILEHYLNVAPYGGNIRGVEAASLAWFGKRANELSLAESATLAGLPQSPERLRPDRHLDAARKRRDMVLRRMAELQMITEQECLAAMSEPVHVTGRGRRSIPAPHLAWMAIQRRPHGGRTTVDLGIQRTVQRHLREHIESLPAGTDAAIVVIDIDDASVTALVGSADPADVVDGQINGATAWRSPGSTLKPFVYAVGFDTARINERSVVHDIPIRRHGWEPDNFDRTFSGRTTVFDALQRSLNVPAILVAEQLGLSRCVGMMESAGVRFRSNANRRGGLATITGAVEVRLIDLVNAYATIGRGGVHRDLRLFEDDPSATRRAIGVDACALLNQILGCDGRNPDVDHPGSWFMWKTGTSSSRRDAWAVGHNGRFAIGVWTGRFSSAGRVDYVGARAAEPLLTTLFNEPALANPNSPDHFASKIVVRKPLPAPAEMGGGLRIVSPHDGSVFVAIGDEATVHPRSNVNGAKWFLDGSMLAAGEAARLRVKPGRHELRCIDDSGGSHAVRFVVRR